MKILVTGTQGQVATSMRERADGETVVCVGRPTWISPIPRRSSRRSWRRSRDVVVNAAAYTAVDKAEKEPSWRWPSMGRRRARSRRPRQRSASPVIHLSTDYVFDGTADRPYREDDPTGPLGAYGRASSRARSWSPPPIRACVVLRTAWVYSPFGKNFVSTMLRLAETRDEIGVVADQIGAPTNALSLADAVIAVARNLLRRPDDPALYGVFHAVDGGEASWAEFAEAIFADLRRWAARRRACGRSRRANIRRPRAAGEFPASTAKLQRVHGVAPRDWRGELNACVDRLVGQGA